MERSSIRSSTKVRAVTILLGAALQLGISGWALGQDLSPNAGERHGAGEICQIRWDPTRHSGNVDLALWDGVTHTWIQIASALPAQRGGFDWLVPATLHGDMFRIRMTSPASPAGYAMSPGYFSITGSTASASGRTEERAMPRFSIKAEPNPAAGELRISSSGGKPASVSLVDISGHTVWSATSPGENLILPASTIPVGTYLLQAVERDGRTASVQVKIAR